MPASGKSQSPQPLEQSLHSRRNVITRGGLALGAMLLPWAPLRRALAATATFDYYISPTGSDSNPGTSASPWAITAINTKQSVYAGKRVGLLDGTYNVYSLVNGGSYLRVGLLVNGGTANSPTVIAAVNPRMAILDAHNPSSRAYPSGSAGIIGVGPGDTPPTLGNFIIDGLAITGSNTFGITIHGKGSGTVNNQGGASGVVVRNCDIYDITSNSFGDNPAAVNPSYLTGFLLQNCRIHPMNNSGSAPVCGLLSFSTTNNIYEYNTIYNSQIAWEEKEGPQGGTTMRYCYIEGYDANYGTIKDVSGGIPGQTTTVHHCVIVGPHPWDNSDSTNPSQISQEGLLCYNCTFYYGGGDFSTAGLIWQAWGATNQNPPAMATLYNNIYYCTGPGSSGSDVIFSAGMFKLMDYNSYRPAAASKGMLYLKPPGGSLAGYTLSAWQATTGQDQHSIAAKPSFVNPTSANPSGYQLAAGSPGIGAGRVGGVATGAACNMGAWDGTVTQIGCNFSPGSTTTEATPMAPVLSVS